MKVLSIIFVGLIFQSVLIAADSQLIFKGHLSAFANYNRSSDFELYSGFRALPQLNYLQPLGEEGLLDFEFSANAYAQAAADFSDSSYFDGKVKPYRIWGRYSNEQFELRIGLQKMDFGQAMLLRPLRWFDTVDPRDPLGLSDGVYAALARYYFLDNTNVWLWGLYGNEGTKGLEILANSSSSLEYGARVQSLMFGGEMGLSYHHRKADTSPYSSYTVSDEHRFGFDARWEFLLGLYLEGMWLSTEHNIGYLRHQHYLTFGSDYTFPLGNGVYTVLEHMIMGFGEEAFHAEESLHLTAFQMSYSLGILDQLATVFYYDWAHQDAYSLVNWHRQYDRLSCYLMAYWNPKEALLMMPGMDSSQYLFLGKGVQAMLVWNF